ncbi:uncharacterized protein AMSG_00271 [Thecamonas trahens ATCC 50062]|uniref:Uncharacterized protein n=1 Tax=Thecamonas trahens ATCC 50062 TaxID=461836 RepID=A0A0L0D4C7_THETB|nr:hypothetical protein AMSG_00271 [Thecamonas trahens ATCC 50062]KNC46153.1 hypothetical protein AMSG_00271 [Thecamonas trahens ATCC 50062]|eukprot:XP_013763129.1 hypothetical protein AMSG_00271 [Thecamonas trahens ATCC 50062]
MDGSVDGVPVGVDCLAAAGESWRRADAGADDGSEAGDDGLDIAHLDAACESWQRVDAGAGGSVDGAPVGVDCLASAGESWRRADAGVDDVAWPDTHAEPHPTTSDSDSASIAGAAVTADISDVFESSSGAADFTAAVAWSDDETPRQDKALAPSSTDRLAAAVLGWRIRVAFSSTRISQLLVQITALTAEAAAEAAADDTPADAERRRRVVATKKEILSVLLTTPASLAAIFVATLQRDRATRLAVSANTSAPDDAFQLAPLRPFSCDTAAAQWSALVLDDDQIAFVDSLAHTRASRAARLQDLASLAHAALLDPRRA